MKNTKWLRTRHDRRCPVCNKPDWCSVSPDRSAAICARIPSDKPAGKNGAGWLHKFDDGDWKYRPLDAWQPKPKPKPDKRFWKWLTMQCCKAMTWEQLKWLADELGIGHSVLSEMRVGWSTRHDAYTFPMRDAAGDVVGLRTRKTDGSKRAVRGTDGNGLFYIPNRLQSDYLIVCEGPTDAAALIDVGFGSVIGKPSCSSGDDGVVRIVKRLRPKVLLLIPDHDKAGLEGFAALALKLVADGFNDKQMGNLQIPHGTKDVRQWKKNSCEYLQRILTAKLNSMTQSEGTNHNEPR